ncbi:unnamed protein product [Lampetra planeri]
MSSLQKKVQLNRLPPRPHVPGSSSSASAASKSHGFGRRRDFTPVSWNLYFESMDDVELHEHANYVYTLFTWYFLTLPNTFRVYRSGSEGPVLLLLHGGGHSALSWAVFTAAISSNIECRVVAVDLRGHGDTHVSNPEDLSAETMAKDVGAVVEALYGENPLPVIMVGHSMGGAIAVHAATANVIPTLVGLIVIDVVEGTAMDALNSMQNFLRGRPKTFKSVENAIEWSVKSGQIRNLESARVSMGGQVKRCESGNASPSKGNGSFCEGIREEDEEGDKEESNHTTQPASPPQSEEGALYTWRIDLSTTERFWEGWFRGLSMLFLSCPVPKMLLLAGVDRLDKDLTIGQMQGKFQMQVLPQCGHAVHEDAPDKVADAISTFMLRHRVVESKGDFKVFVHCRCSLRAMRSGMSSLLGAPLFLLLLLSQGARPGSAVGAQSEMLKASRNAPKTRNDGIAEETVYVLGDGFLQSPRFPLGYPRGLALQWRLLAKAGARIQLGFDERFGLEEPEHSVCKYDYVEVEDVADGASSVRGRWCGAKAPSGKQISKSNQLLVRFRSDEYFPAKPGFRLYYSSVDTVGAPLAKPLPPPLARRRDGTSAMEVLSHTLSAFETLEDMVKFLEPESWQVELDRLAFSVPQARGRSSAHGRRWNGELNLNRLREEVRLYSCTPRNYSVSLREELGRTDTVFWPSCVLVRRCGGNCACCAHNCTQCRCKATRTARKVHEVLQIKAWRGSFHKNLTDVHLEHHEACQCTCANGVNG